MSSKNVSLLLNFHHPYIRFSDEKATDNIQKNVLLFEKISNIYIPLLNMLSRLEKQNLKFKINIVFSSPLCALLSDELVKSQYVSYLDNLIQFGKKEIARTKFSKDLHSNAEQNLEKAIETKRYFVEVYEQNLLKYFASFAKKGIIEILATCGTYVFMPHYSDMPEILNAQVETGLYSVRHYFGISAEGFFLPEMGYVNGLEKVLRMYGVSYTILPTQSFLLSSTAPEKGIFSPARCYNALSLFAADYAKLDYHKNNVYKNRNCDVAWELDINDVEPFTKKGQPRARSGFCYWNNAFIDSEINSKESKSPENIYNFENANSQILIDSDDFVCKCENKLQSASQILKNVDVSMSYVFDEHMLYRSWDEGLIWFENIIKKFIDYGVNVTSYSDLLIDKFSLQKIQPYFASGSQESYGEDFLSIKNSWMIRYLRKACSRMVDLAGRFSDDSGLKVRLLNLGSKELMLAQSLELSKMLDLNVYPEFVEKLFKDNMIAFTAVFDALGSNTVSTEWLCNLEREHDLFPWMNFRIFSKKN